jgi:hypothetical protein
MSNSSPNHLRKTNVEKRNWKTKAPSDQRAEKIRRNPNNRRRFQPAKLSLPSSSSLPTKNEESRPRGSGELWPQSKLHRPECETCFSWSGFPVCESKAFPVRLSSGLSSRAYLSAL